MGEERVVEREVGNDSVSSTASTGAVIAIEVKLI
jgi:hypothetical protein